MGKIEATDTLAIDEDEVSYAFVRASGPGGQNVNKVETAVELRFDVARSPSLSDPVKRRLAKLAGRRMTLEGVLVIFAQTHRSQERNRAEALARLVALIGKAAVVPKRRIKTRVPLSAKRERVDSKTRRGATKKLRGAPVD